ncbi:hypothetical protein Gotur_027230 [Gossypium turneri]
MVSTAWRLRWGLKKIGESGHNGSEKLRLREVFTSAWDSESLPGYIRTYVFIESLSWKRGFFDKVEDNAAVRTWAEMTQREKGDSLTEGHMSELWDFTRISVIQNDLREMKETWDQWDNETNCFTFGKVDLTPTVEEYTTLLRCPKIQVEKAYCRAADLVLVHPDVKKRVDVFALGIYGLVVFPKALGHIDEAVSDLFDQLSRGVTPVPAILVETFRSLNACWRAGEGRFVRCAQLLLAWFHSHFWKVENVSYRVFSDSYSPLEELVAMPRRDDFLEEKWMAILQNLRDEDVEWRAPWLIPDEILYRYRNFDWVLLLGIWGAIGYAPLLVSR